MAPESEGDDDDEPKDPKIKPPGANETGEEEEEEEEENSGKFMKIHANISRLSKLKDVSLLKDKSVKLVNEASIPEAVKIDI